MKSFYLKVCLPCCFFLGVIADCLAKKPVEEVSFDFQCIGLSQEFRQLDLYFSSGNEGERQRIRLGNLSKSLVAHYRGPRLVLFYDQPSGGQPVAGMRLKPSIKSPIFIFGKAPEGAKHKYMVFQLENDWSVYGANSYVLVNLSSYVLHWKVGGERFKLEAKRKHAISVDAGREKTPVIALESDINGKVSRVYRARWRNAPNMRRLIFIRDCGANELGKVSVQVVEDYATMN